LNSFPRNHRLVNKAEFKSVFDASAKVSQRYILALYKPNCANKARIGIIVGKRVARLAVERNQIKRVIRESFRAIQEQLQHLDIVVIARQQCDSLDKVQLREGIDKLWQRLVTQYQKVSL
jgi:ribonuclease P protein component